MLDHGVRDFGYAVFGKVVKGMDVVDTIVNSQTTNKGGMQNVPVDPILIKSVKVVN
jgi:peptidyl-prolyl cis-trans isomerase A (cyclophilin A)